MLSGDAQVPLATTERIVARNYRKFSQREIDVIQINWGWRSHLG
jgi:hypothetical protein